ncbi:hypothetical protein OG874_00265 [Nocardia sp. NBC_00565]|nr:hypothetical protein [Nocardia sp. NBC_00565]WUC03688.1 hypothetical protein OG874_00265 [Nocardia sp. NBC_00565]
MNYEIRCPHCGAKFTAYEWSHHAPDCPYVTDPLAEDGEQS